MLSGSSFTKYIVGKASMNRLFVYNLSHFVLYNVYVHLPIAGMLNAIKKPHTMATWACIIVLHWYCARPAGPSRAG